MGKSHKQSDGHGEKKRSKDKDQKHKKDKAKEKDMKKKKKKDKRTDQQEAGKQRHKEKKHRPSGSDTSGASSSSSSSSDEDIGLLSPRQQLQRERQAVNTLRDLLSTHAAARKDLRELLWTLDQGKAAHLAGVADEQLRTQLISMLKLLGCARAGTKGSFMLAPGQAKSLSVLGPVFDEPPRPPPTAPVPTSRPSTTTPAPGPAPAASQGPTAPPIRRPIQGPSAPPEPGPMETQAPIQGPTMPPARPASDSHTGFESEPHSPTTAQAAGPVVRPPEGPLQGSNRQNEEEPGKQEAVPGPRRLGPALPPPEVLAAAAAAAEEGLLGAASDEEDEDEDGLMVGPVPPELLQEDEAMPEDAREAEVLRIMRILRDAQAAADASGAGKPAPLIALAADAYDVLGVSRETPAGEVKKRYMKLSLLIHPDKCNHKDAHAAFQAVAQAAKVLQDSGSRAALDEALDECKLRKMAMEAAVVAERERAWRVARGEELPGASSMAAGGGLGPIVRESWMTELPAEKAAALAGAMMNQVSQRAFSRFGIKARGDTSAWTDTPQQRSARERDAALGAAQGPLLIAGAGGAQHGARGTAADAKVLDAFNAQARKRTLLEQHMEQKQQQSAATAKKPKTDDKPAATVSRPFDRGRDLEIKRKPLDPAALLKNQEQLGQKFSSAGGARHFL